MNQANTGVPPGDAAYWAGHRERLEQAAVAAGKKHGG